MKITLDSLTGPNTAFMLGQAFGRSAAREESMDRMYFGLVQYGADGFPKTPEPISERHARERAEMDERLNDAIEIMIEKASEGQEIPETRQWLKEVIAEYAALQLEHQFEWNR